MLTSSGGIKDYYRWDGKSGKTWIPSSGTTDIGDTVIPFGQGLWVENTAECTANFQTAGEVSKSDIIQPLDAEGGSVMVANNFPVAVKLKNIIPTTDTGTDLRRKIQIQLLTSSGGIKDYYRWDGKSGKTRIPSSGTTDIGDTEIPAGTAMWVENTANCAATLRVCAPTTNL